MDGRPIKTNESFSHERERETIFIKKHWPAVAIFTDGRDDGDGVEQSAAKRPLPRCVVLFSNFNKKKIKIKKKKIEIDRTASLPS